MNTEDMYEHDLKKVAEEVGRAMDGLNTVHDGIQIHVNHFNQWVAKYKTQDGVTHHAFGRTLLNALTNLRDEPNKEV